MKDEKIIRNLKNQLKKWLSFDCQLSEPQVNENETSFYVTYPSEINIGETEKVNLSFSSQ